LAFYFHIVKKLIVTKVEQREKLDRFNDDGRKRTKDTKITLATWNAQTMLVERDLQVLGVRRWRKLVIDGEKWKDIVGQAKANSGL